MKNMTPAEERFVSVGDMWKNIWGVGWALWASTCIGGALVSMVVVLKELDKRTDPE